eukprot:12054745-Karenia_brevis.AAC.1
MSRRSGWGQILLDEKQAFKATIIEVLELLRIRYPKHVIKNSWHKSMAADAYYSVGQKAFDFTIDGFKFPGFRWFLPDHVHDALAFVFDLDISPLYF